MATGRAYRRSCYRRGKTAETRRRRIDLAGTSILFAWELGANLGHIKPLMALARAFAARGARPVFAVHELGNMHLAAKRGEFTILQAPVWPEHKHWGHKPRFANYADVLTGVGFADPIKLSCMLSAWDALLDWVRPSLVVVDHSPALQCALHGSQTPVVAVGTPFTMPPLSLERLPPLRADQAPALPESRLLQAVKTCLAERGVRSPARLVDLFRTDERLIFGVPELDPYRAFRDEPLVTPPEPLPAYVEPPIKRRLFLYAGSEVIGLETLVQALVEMDIDIVAYLRGDVGPLPHFLRHRGHKVYDTPPPLAEVLPTVSHVLSQGGAFTSLAALSAGRPHLIVSLHGESDQNLMQLSALGVARELELVKSAKVIRAAVDGFLMETAMIRHARNWAKILAERPQKSGLDETMAAVTRVLDGVQMRSSRLRAAAAAAQPSK